MNPKSVHELRTKIFADGADRDAILALNKKDYIKGFTTNPTLMRKAGITDYEKFARSILEEIPDKPFSFEVFADDFESMSKQADIIARWGDNVYVKIPITNTQGESAKDLIRRLAGRGYKLNITAMTTVNQAESIMSCFDGSPSSYISIFAGRVADTGRDPVAMMARAVEVLKPHKNLELIWASPRELLNIYHADQVGCHIITVTPEILKKLDLIGKDLNRYSLETVQMFYEDGQKSGFHLG
ncbi:MAG TPA: transaldolase [Spirochaetia bacterium]|nr:transaldolase [Spirochaetia bacterium]